MTIPCQVSWFGFLWFILYFIRISDCVGNLRDRNVRYKNASTNTVLHVTSSNFFESKIVFVTCLV